VGKTLGFAFSEPETRVLTTSSKFTNPNNNLTCFVLTLNRQFAVIWYQWMHCAECICSSCIQNSNKLENN